MKLQIYQKEQLYFCLRFGDSNNDVIEQFLKFIHYDEGVSGRDLLEAVTKTLLEFCLDRMNCSGEGLWGGRYDREG